MFQELPKTELVHKIYIGMYILYLYHMILFANLTNIRRYVI